ncbi:MAG: hypothetical protein ACUVQZ_03470 [Candidatus Caldatribacteriaceae bacterium]
MSLLPLKRNLNPFSLTILIITSILLPATSFADADRIFRENSKTVVFIEAYDNGEKLIGQGSGFVVREDGAIVTSYDVIRNAQSVKVKTKDKLMEVEGLSMKIKVMALLFSR